jgi:hypothetical protein
MTIRFFNESETVPTAWLSVIIKITKSLGMSAMKCVCGNDEMYVLSAGGKNHSDVSHQD